MRNAHVNFAILNDILFIFHKKYLQLGQSDVQQVFSFLFEYFYNTHVVSYHKKTNLQENVRTSSFVRYFKLLMEKNLPR